MRLTLFVTQVCDGGASEPIPRTELHLVADRVSYDYVRLRQKLLQLQVHDVTVAVWPRRIIHELLSSGYLTSRDLASPPPYFPPAKAIPITQKPLRVG